jgi:DNA-binding transcriptional ArsR family regulator
MSPSAGQLLEALNSPIRRQVLRTLSEEEGMSPSRISEKLGMKLNTLSYHVRHLSEREVVVQTGSRQVRGALEHFYRCDFGEHADLARALLEATAAEDGDDPSSKTKA